MFFVIVVLGVVVSCGAVQDQLLGPVELLDVVWDFYPFLEKGGLVSIRVVTIDEWCERVVARSEDDVDGAEPVVLFGALLMMA